MTLILINICHFFSTTASSSVASRTRSKLGMLQSIVDNAFQIDAEFDYDVAGEHIDPSADCVAMSDHIETLKQAASNTIQQNSNSCNGKAKGMAQKEIVEQKKPLRNVTTSKKVTAKNSKRKTELNGLQADSIIKRNDQRIKYKNSYGLDLVLRQAFEKDDYNGVNIRRSARCRAGSHYCRSCQGVFKNARDLFLHIYLKNKNYHTGRRNLKERKKKESKPEIAVDKNEPLPNRTFVRGNPLIEELERRLNRQYNNPRKRSKHSVVDKPTIPPKLKQKGKLSSILENTDQQLSPKQSRYRCHKCNGNIISSELKHHDRICWNIQN